MAGGGIGGGWGGGGVCYKTNMRLKRQRLVVKVIHSASKVAFQDVSFVKACRAFSVVQTGALV